MQQLTVTDYAELNKISRQAVLKKISKGQLKAEKKKNEWIITIEEKDSIKRFQAIWNKISGEIDVLEFIRDNERFLTPEEKELYDFYYKILEMRMGLSFNKEVGTDK